MGLVILVISAVIFAIIVVRAVLAARTPFVRPPQRFAARPRAIVAQPRAMTQTQIIRSIPADLRPLPKPPKEMGTPAEEISKPEDQEETPLKSAPLSSTLSTPPRLTPLPSLSRPPLSPLGSRESLIAERERLARRLAEIDTILGQLEQRPDFP